MPDEPQKPDVTNLQKHAESAPSKDGTPIIAGEEITADHEQAALKANQSAASKLKGLEGTPNKLDGATVLPTFDRAGAKPAPEAEAKKENPAPALQPPAPAPGGGGSSGGRGGGGGGPHVSPQLLEPSERDAKREAFKKEMLIRREFKRNARDVTRDR